MITRCVEIDHREMAQKIIDDMHPHEKFAIQQFEENLTRRGTKKPFFHFTTVSIVGTDKAGKVDAVSLSGICALNVIADKEEMKESSTEIEDLFEVLWKNEVFVRPKENTDTFVKSVKVLQAIYTSLVSKFPGKTLRCITTKDVSKPLRKSLNECTQLLRARGDFNSIEYKKWAEIYYQVSVLIFGEQGLTPFKLKLLLMPQLVVSNFKRSPKEHLCEALEKFNHHANKDFQSRTMRGGGRLHNQDPLFLEMFFSFCEFIKSGKCTCSFLNNAGDVLGGTNPIPSYLQICQTNLEFRKVAVGE